MLGIKVQPQQKQKQDNSVATNRIEERGKTVLGKANKKVLNESIYIYIYIVNLATQRLPTTLRCKGRRNFFLWIAPFYPWYVYYNAEC